MLGAGDEGHDRLCRQVRVHVRPVGGGVGGHHAVHDDLTGQRQEHVLRGQREIGAVDVAGKDDAVIAELDLDDIGDAIGLAGLDFRVLDLAAGIGDIDGIFAHTFAELLQPGRRPATFDHGGREAGIFGKGLGHDIGIGQHGRGPRDLNLITRGGDRGRGGDDGQGRDGELDGFHRITPEHIRTARIGLRLP